MDFTKLTAYLDSLHRIHVPGCDLIVCQDHKVIYRHQAGFSDVEARKPMQGNETYRYYSATKLFTTCAAMQLIEKEMMHLDDPVRIYMPSFAHLTVKEGENVRPAKTEMTVRHLMSMQSGLNYDLGSPAVRKVMEDTNGQATTRQLIDAKMQDPLEFDPGRDFQYSLSHDALGALVEAVSGQRLSAYLREHIWAPLGIEQISFEMDDEMEKNLCKQYRYEPAKDILQPDPITRENYRSSPNFESGGGGLMGGVDEYALFADALACGGKSKNGQQILSNEMIQLWSTNQLGPRSRATFDTWKRMGYSYGLGVRTRVNPLIGGAGAMGEFGWDGAAGAWTMVDPQNRLSAFFAMQVMNYGYAFDVIHPTIRSLIYESIF